jgi:hypothetical protein
MAGRPDGTNPFPVLESDRQTSNAVKQTPTHDTHPTGCIRPVFLRKNIFRFFQGCFQNQCNQQFYRRLSDLDGDLTNSLPMETRGVDRIIVLGRGF